MHLLLLQTLIQDFHVSTRDFERLFLAKQEARLQTDHARLMKVKLSNSGRIKFHMVLKLISNS